MKTSVLDRIKLRMQELGMAPEAVSKKAGLDRSYLRRLFDRGASPRVETLTKIATALEVAPEALLSTDILEKQSLNSNVLLDDAHGNATRGSNYSDQDKVYRAAPIEAVEVSPAQVAVPNNANMNKDLPVLGTAAGSHAEGVFSLESTIIDYVRRPPGMKAVKDAYALYVEGDSMEPKFSSGDLIIVHPRRPPRNGDYVVVQFKRGECDYQEAIIGILHKRTPTKVEIEKLNPQNILTFDNDCVIHIHRILSLNDLLGV